MSTFGLFPNNVASLNYFFSVDLDNNPATGGSPSQVGVPGSTQGIELVGRVQVNVISGVPQGTPTVWKFQSGQFIQVTDPSIQTIVGTLYGGAASSSQSTSEATPSAQIIQLLLSNNIRGSIADNVNFTAITENTNTGTIDSVEGSIRFVPLSFPSCQVEPDGALLGSTINVTASSLPTNHPVSIYLGAEQMNIGVTNGTGDINIEVVIPTDTSTGTRQISVHADGTAVAADCDIQLWSYPKFDVPPSPSDGASFTVNIGETLQFPIQASDLDAEEGDVVTLDVIGLPSGASFSAPSPANPASATFSWTPTSSQEGSYVVVFTAQDSFGLAATPLSIIINVTENSFPSTSILDTFNRANGGIGSAWSGNTAGYNIDSNQLSVDYHGSNNDVYWKNEPFGANQEAYVTFTQVDSAGDEQILLLKSQSNITWGDGVLEVVYRALNNRVEVVTWDWPQGWVQHGADIPVTFADGDTLGARALADGTVEVYKNGTLLAARDITSWSHYADGGYVGLWFIGAEDAVLDNFGGGTLASGMQSITARSSSPSSQQSITSAQLNVTVNSSTQFWQGVPLGQTASVTFTSLQASLKPQSNGVWGEGTVQVLYDIPNQRIQVWMYDTAKSWTQIGKDIPVKFTAGDTFTVSVLSDGTLEISRNGNLLVKRKVSP